MKMRCRGLS